MLTTEYTRALQHSSTTHVGRSNEYKDNASCLHIGDLKVPKKYINICLGRSSVDGLSQTLLTIQFQSICTTDINGTIYKLRSKDAEPKDVLFSEKRLLLKVNANKSDLIRIVLEWVDLRIMVPKVLSAESIIEKLINIHLKGLDIRIAGDTLEATHYMALSLDVEEMKGMEGTKAIEAIDRKDFILQICVLRGIPIITEKWISYALDHLENPNHWLTGILTELLLPVDYSRAEPNRADLLMDQNVVVFYNISSQNQLKQLERWLQCLLVSSIVTIDIDNPEAKEKLRLSTIQNIIIFDLSECVKIALNFLLNVECNSIDDLWKSVVQANISSLKMTTELKFDAANTSNHDLEKTNFKREAEIFSDLRHTQRKRRRKVERVNETDFFLFTLSAMPTQESPPLDQSVPTADTDKMHLFKQSSLVTNEGIVLENSPSKQIDTNDLRDVNPTLELDSNPAPETQKMSLNHFEHDAQGNFTQSDSNELESQLAKSFAFTESSGESVPLKNALKRNSDEGLGLENGHQLKKQRLPISSVKQVSFAKAVISAKKEAEEGFKLESYVETPIDEVIANLIIVEEIELCRPTKAEPSLQTNSHYEGRRNFKAFKRVNEPKRSITRTYIQLFDQEPSSFGRATGTCQKANDFADMGTVNGFQPESEGLFVGEDSESDEKDNGFSFASVQSLTTSFVKSDDESEDESDGGEPRFKFSN